MSQKDIRKSMGMMRESISTWMTWAGFVMLILTAFIPPRLTYSQEEKLYTQLGMRMVSIPGGSFQMGSTDGDEDEKPVHTVMVSAFSISATEVTQGQYQRVKGSNPSYFKLGDNYPVEQVKWYDAVLFCNKLSDAAGLDRCYNEILWTCDISKNGFRLPTEAEWEYACRAVTGTKYYTGDNESTLGRAGWYDKNSESKIHPVGQRTPNAWGLYDMHGNVWEWCNDFYGSYSSGSVTDPIGPSSGSERIYRGGGWNGPAKYCRSADRVRLNPLYRYSNLGFRVVRR